MPVIIDGTNGLTFPDNSRQYNGYFGFKNRIINGDMRIDQRNAGASVTGATTNPFSVDRWQTVSFQNSKYTAQQNAGAVTPPAGFVNYLGVTSSSAYSVLAGDYFAIQQIVEGFNIADLAWGTANAATVTLSFWVRSSLTGTFGGVLKNGGGSRSYPFSYTITSANTWEQKSITIPGDTTGTWLTTNGQGIIVGFGLGTGSTFSGTAGAWAAANIVQPTSTVSVVGTNGATFYITGVQLEEGVVSTNFDVRPYGTELQLCQRYYQRWNTGTANIATWGAGPVSNSTSAQRLGATLSTPMRSSPTFNYSNARIFDGTAAPVVTSILANTCTATNMCVDLGASGGGLTTGRFVVLIENATSGYIDFTAEL